MSRNHMPRQLGTIALSILLLASGPAVGDELYKWKDANGVTHYADTPPDKNEYQTINQSRDRTQVVATDAAKVKTETKATPSQQACIDARSNLELLQSGQPVSRDSDGDGKPDTALTDAQRGQQTALAEAAIAVHCDGEAPAATEATANT